MGKKGGKKKALDPEARPHRAKGALLTLSVVCQAAARQAAAENEEKKRCLVMQDDNSDLFSSFDAWASQRHFAARASTFPRCSPYGQSRNLSGQPKLNVFAAVPHGFRLQPSR